MLNNNISQTTNYLRKLYLRPYLINSGTVYRLFPFPYENIAIKYLDTRSSNITVLSQTNVEHFAMVGKKFQRFLRTFSSTVFDRKKNSSNPCCTHFEHVYSFPIIKYIALVNRLKIYHLYGTGIIVPSCGIMEFLNVVSENTFLISSYIGITGAIALTLGTIPMKNIIGHLYISEDNKSIKISSVGFSGKRTDKIVDVDDWIPLLQMEPKKTDIIFLSPQLKDGTKFKFFVKFGIIKNSSKIGTVLE